tara:strand:+ start:114 stop:869 length:756 start_codon:yes stop_codon:yes gene_type:complete
MQKKIWITGASSGIGKSLAIKFAENGWKVAISARRVEKLEEICKINKNIHSFPLDVLNIDQCNHTFNKILEKFDNIDKCIFCVGIRDHESEKNLELNKIEKIFKTNFFGNINTISSVYSYYKNKKEGHISVIGSIAGYRGLPESGAYSASKSALITFVESLYFDLSKYNVKLSLINPGFINTDMVKNNKYKMPLIMSSDYAARIIYSNIIKNKNFEIHFPKRLSLLMKFLSILPFKLYSKLIKIGSNLINR